MADEKLSDDFNPGSTRGKKPHAEFDHAIFTQDVDKLKSLVKELRLPRQERTDFLTAELRKACALVYQKAVNLTIIDTLIDAGGKMTQPQGHDASPFGIICQSNDVTVLRHMIKRGADVNADVNIDQFGASKPLHFVCSHGQNPEMVAELLNNRANPNAKGFFEQTPLHMAASARPKRNGNDGDDRTPVIEMLLKAGAKIDAVDKSEQTPLLAHISHSPNVTVAEKLIDAGTNLKHVSRTDGSALHLAAERGLFEIVDLLVEKGAPLLLKNAQGRTPRQHAQENFAAKYQSLMAQGPVPQSLAPANDFGVSFGKSMQLLEQAEKNIGKRNVRKIVKHKWGL
jgi:ankyrin repeat protein